MSKFDQIIAAEKTNKYKLDDQDQFVFDTLTAIQSSRANRLKRLLIIVVAVIAILAILVQVLFLQTATFTELIAQLKLLLAQKPYYLALFNLGLVGVILFFKRVRIF